MHYPHIAAYDEWTLLDDADLLYASYGSAKRDSLPNPARRSFGPLLRQIRVSILVTGDVRLHLHVPGLF